MRNIVTTKERWDYLLLYEIDGHEDSNAIGMIATFDRMQTSYIVYKTKNGFHAVGLTPMNAQEWGYNFQRLQNVQPEYFSGHTLRISLKENEKQELIHYSLRFPYLENLFGMYNKRFNIPKDGISLYHNPPKYNLVFEKYWSVKI